MATDACRDSSSLTTETANACGRVFRQSTKRSVKRFAQAFPLPILHIKSHEIDEWLRKLGGAPRTRNTVHTSIRTFFSWAKARSYLPKNETTEAEAVSKVKVGDTETGIFTPAQLKSLLAIATPEMIPFIAIGAFAGLRAAGTFWVYGGICIAGFIFVFTSLPETKGQSLEQIENDLIGRR